MENNTQLGRLHLYCPAVAQSDRPESKLKVWHKGIIAKLGSLGVRGALQHLLQDYLDGRTLRTVVNGHTSGKHPSDASVPQGSIVGPLLWNVYFNDILQLIPEAQAYADDCTLSFSCDTKKDWRDTVRRINEALSCVLEQEMVGHPRNTTL
ncbi:hypothetical protein Pmani_034584 [Petrolisthes manimaculis]|uniref:Reverse transcriptase domain-containing protein n=1 Tax=Petrolisthes manimaculis TaxID=1843537 RepID=A0AAE1TP93_9EUCA|nr:hypothetical protein Pmani_034584 [Petrolisthes manimaculis]